MAKYEQIALPVDAVQYRAGQAPPDGVHLSGQGLPYCWVLGQRCLVGDRDWVVTHASGGVTVVDHDSFQLSYRPVGADANQSIEIAPDMTPDPVVAPMEPLARYSRPGRARPSGEPDPTPDPVSAEPEPEPEGQ